MNLGKIIFSAILGLGLYGTSYCAQQSAENKRIVEYNALVEQAKEHRERDAKIIDAVRASETATVRLLLKAGANPNAIILTEEGMLFPILSAAIARNNRDIVLELINCKADPNGTWYQGGEANSLVTSIVFKTLTNKESLPTFKLLVDCKANLDGKDSCDMTFHHACAVSKLPEATALLLNHNTPVNSQNWENQSPICLAATSLGSEERAAAVAMGLPVEYTYPNVLQVKLLLHAGGAVARRDLMEHCQGGYLYGDEQSSELANKKDIVRMAEFGLADEDHAECVRLITEMSPMQPSTRGNIFNQLRMRECGVRAGTKKPAVKPEKEDDKNLK